MTKFSKIGAIALLALATMSVRAEAQMTWNWSFGSNAGTFSTDGSGGGPGTYLLTDFAVTSSGQGATIGSSSGGQYTSAGYGTTQPYAMSYNGSAVTLWDSAGGNSFDWWVFTDNGDTSQSFFFGWGTGNTNSADQAAYYPSSFESSTVTVSAAVTATPEPATFGLMALGLAGLAATRRKSRAA